MENFLKLQQEWQKYGDIIRVLNTVLYVGLNDKHGEKAIYNGTPAGVKGKLFDLCDWLAIRHNHRTADFEKFDSNTDIYMLKEFIYSGLPILVKSHYSKENPKTPFNHGQYPMIGVHSISAFTACESINFNGLTIMKHIQNADTDNLFKAPSPYEYQNERDNDSKRYKLPDHRKIPKRNCPDTQEFAPSHAVHGDIGYSHILVTIAKAQKEKALVDEKLYKMFNIEATSLPDYDTIEISPYVQVTECISILDEKIGAITSDEKKKIVGDLLNLVMKYRD